MPRGGGGKNGLGDDPLLAAAVGGIYFRNLRRGVRGPAARSDCRKDPVLSEQTVTIRFEGRPLACRADTSVAAALWEHGVRDLSHSPKYGRPRGVTCARGHCTACLMRVDGVPNVRVCETPVREGQTVQRQDTGAFYGAPMQKVLATGDALFPVGFYYKWFTRPPFVSRTFLRTIRPLTGVGRLPEAADLPADSAGPGPSRDLGRWRTVVVGAGAAGMRAAAAAAGPVLLLDENDEPGGLRLAALRTVAAGPTVHGESFPCLSAASAGLEQAAAALAASTVDLRLGCRVVAGYAPGGLLVRQGSELATLRADEVIWAAGALDTLGLFPGNDTPGAMGPRALYRLLLRDGLQVAGRHALLVGDGLDLWLSATLLATRGARISLMIGGHGMPAEIAGAVRMKWQLNSGLALGGLARRGRDLVQATFAPGGHASAQAETHMRMDADLVVLCGRGKPTYDIPYQLGAQLTLDPAAGGFVAPPASTLPGAVPLTVAGEAAGLVPDLVLGAAPEVTP